MEEEEQLCSSNQKLNLKEENENLLRIMFKREFWGKTYYYREKSIYFSTDEQRKYSSTKM